MWTKVVDSGQVRLPFTPAFSACGLLNPWSNELLIRASLNTLLHSSFTLLFHFLAIMPKT